MENISKALLIAGGIVIAMITISLFYVVFRSTSPYAERYYDTADKKALQAFNKSYEAYNKKLMYGMDVVTVLNMAIDNNKRYGLSQNYAENSNKDFVDFYVDVVFEYKGYDNSVRELRLSTDYATIDEKVLQIAALSTEERINRADEPRVYPDCYAFIHNLQQSAYYCDGISYRESAEIKYNTGAIGRVKEIRFKRNTRYDT